MENIVVCTRCGREIFRCLAVGRDHAGASIRAADFVPLEDIPSPQDSDLMLCPCCGDEFVHRRGSVAILKLRDGYWWPSPPLTHLP